MLSRACAEVVAVATGVGVGVVADERAVATVEDVALVAPMAMRQRRSDFMEQYFEAARTEDREIQEACAAARKQVSP